MQRQRESERERQNWTHTHTHTHTYTHTRTHTHTHTHARTHTQLTDWLEAAHKQKLGLDPQYLKKVKELAEKELRNDVNSAKVCV